MTEVPRALGALTLFVDDHARSKAFYARVLDASPIWEDANSVVFALDDLMLNLLDRGQAPGLVGPAPVAPGGAASLQLTIWVDDADTAAAELERRGAELLNGPQDRPWGVRTACFADPDGHVWEIAQQLGAGAA